MNGTIATATVEAIVTNFLKTTLIRLTMTVSLSNKYKDNFSITNWKLKMLMNKKAETLKETVTPTPQNLIKKNLLFQMKKTLATTKGICPLKKTLRH